MRVPRLPRDLGPLANRVRAPRWGRRPRRRRARSSSSGAAAAPALANDRSPARSSCLARIPSTGERPPSTIRQRLTRCTQTDWMARRSARPGCCTHTRRRRGAARRRSRTGERSAGTLPRRPSSRGGADVRVRGSRTARHQRPTARTRRERGGPGHVQRRCAAALRARASASRASEPGHGQVAIFRRSKTVRLAYMWRLGKRVSERLGDSGEVRLPRVPGAEQVDIAVGP